jgi:ADP-ribose pyrophosphatase YjhB (NUDIX family)
VVDETEQAARWRVFGERGLYDNPWVSLLQVDVEAPNGRRFWHHVVRLRPIAVAVVRDEQGRVLMLWRHRFLPDVFDWELPGGFAGEQEDLATAAGREVEEETGWRPTGRPEHLITFYPVPGMVDSHAAVYLFRGAELVGRPTDGEEAGHVAWLSLDELAELVKQGKVLGAASLVGLLHFLALSPAHR